MKHILIMVLVTANPNPNPNPNPNLFYLGKTLGPSLPGLEFREYGLERPEKCNNSATTVPKSVLVTSCEQAPSKRSVGAQ